MLEGFHVEVKKVSGGTLNQVRAVKYLTLVAYEPDRDIWYVVPPHEVVRLVAGKARGQHCENPFESSTVSLSAITGYRVAGADLRQAVLGAARAGEAQQTIKTAMGEVLADAVEGARTARARVREDLMKADQDTRGALLLWD